MASGPRTDSLDTMSAGRMKRAPFADTFPEVDSPGSVTHVDVFQISKNDLPQVPTSGARRTRRGKPYRYGIVFVDDYSRRLMVFGLNGMTDVEIEKCFRWYSMQLGSPSMTGSQWTLGPGAQRHFQMDGGTSLVSQRIERLIAQLGFGATVTSAPDTPQNNAIAESAVRYLRQRLAATMTAGSVPAADWYYAMVNIVAAHNKLASQRAIDSYGVERRVSPHELFTGKRPTWRHSVICGAPCRVLRLGMRARNEGDFTVRGRPGRVYCWGGDGLQIDGTYRCVLGYVCRLDDGRIEFSREVRINETAILEGGHSPDFPAFAAENSHSPPPGPDFPEIDDGGDLNPADDGHATGSDTNSEPASDVDDDSVPALHDMSGSDCDSVSDAEEDAGQGDELSVDSADHIPPAVGGSLRAVSGSEVSPTPADATLGNAPSPWQQRANRVTPAVLDGLPAWLRADMRNARAKGVDLAHHKGREDRSSRSRPQQPLFGSLGAIGLSLLALAAATSMEDEDQDDDVVQTNPGPALPLMHKDDVTVPRNYVEAMRSSQHTFWRQAVDEHLAGHQIRGTFKEEVVPLGTRVLPTQWVFALKTNELGYVTRFKARTVLGGHRQVAGVDYQEVFSPTLRAEQVRLLLAIGAQMQGCPLQSLDKAQVRCIRPADVVNAYLQSELGIDEQPLHALPQGYVPTTTAPPGSRVVGRSIYAHPGLKQSGRAWHRTQRAQLLARGFVECPAAPCIFFKDLGGGKFIAVGTFVDDLLWLSVCDDPLAIDKIVADLKGHYEVKLASSLDKFLGANFRETESGIFMHLRQYVTELLARHGMTGCKSASTPEATARDLGVLDESLLHAPDVKLFQQITGGLMFAATTVRLDIAHAVGMLARRMARPRTCDMTAAKRVLRYLSGTVGHAIFFPYQTNASTPGLVAYADSDYASDPVHRKSTTGYIVFYNGVPVSWKSHLQDTIAQSVCEAEYIALAECSREVVYLRNVVGFLGRDTLHPTTIYEDNEGSIRLVNNPVNHGKTKHIEVKFHYTRHVQERGLVKVVKIHTDDNSADIFTKATDQRTFVRHVSSLMSIPPL